MPDIDIDFIDRNEALACLRHIPAAMHTRGERLAHPSGVYFQDAPVDPIDGLCSFDYETANQRGYFKIDFLNNSMYQGVRDEQHLLDLLHRDPPWELLSEPAICNQLAHIGDYVDVVRSIKPVCIEDLAVVIALIRPAKRKYIGQPRSVIDQHIWQKSEEFSFKRPHALSYAAAIVVQLNLMIEHGSK